tara:strand:+ start:2599 stop:2976 length:378 start_codon:yes stop_codon:yes gene_type:complete
MKNIDVSVLPDGFLLQINHVTNNILHGWSEKIKAGELSNDQLIYRPALNYWHFSDGKMILPDGLIVECVGVHKRTIFGFTCDSMIVDERDNYPSCYDLSTEILAVKILGVTAEYGAQLGMEVIEL